MTDCAERSEWVSNFEWVSNIDIQKVQKKFREDVFERKDSSESSEKSSESSEKSSESSEKSSEKMCLKGKRI